MLQEASVAVRKAITTRKMFRRAFFKIPSFALELVPTTPIGREYAITLAASGLS